MDRKDRRRIEEGLRDARWVGWKLLIWGLVAVLILGTLSFVCGIVSLPFRSARGIADRTLDADNVIYNYEWFKTQHESVGALRRQLRNATNTFNGFIAEAGRRDSWGFEEKQESARLRAVVLGLNNRLEDAVALYNARSRMVNRAIFKTGDEELPERIDP